MVAGSHPRHRAIVDAIIETGFFSQVHCLVMEREHLDQAPNLRSYCNSEEEFQLLQHHFAWRGAAESVAFGESGLSESSGKTFHFSSCNLSNLNQAVQEILHDYKPGAFIAVGPGMFSEAVLSRLPSLAFNVHLGFSPRYRGSATLFWPSYFLEPWFSGVTFHRFTVTPDSGGILHQSVPSLEQGMSVHDSSIAAITAGIDELPTVLGHLVENPETPGIQQGVGKTFLVKDFRPHHLLPIYKLFDGYVIDSLWPKEPHSLPRPVNVTTLTDWE